MSPEQGMGESATVERPQNSPLQQTKTITYTISTRLQYLAKEMEWLTTVPHLLNCHSLEVRNHAGICATSDW